MIPQKIRKTFKVEKCFTCPSLVQERHHSLLYSGRQINELYTIIGLCKNCHRGNNGTTFPEVKKKCAIKAIKDGLEHLKINYPKRNWEQELRGLEYELSNLQEKNQIK
ncbi:MAG: hypothetical protein ABIJ17_01065 [Patescibacteria group bacterium]